MTSPKPRSRFLPTLTEVVHPGSIVPGVVQTQVANPPPAAVYDSRALFALQQELAHALQIQLRVMLDAQLQQLLPQLHAGIDTAVHEAVAKAIVARIAATD
ncbi:MAG: hypothetical protein KGN32_00265 [Burkholderiales bacterium]|nr:hypothetical protein [Burkholderiales bacterium]